MPSPLLPLLWSLAPLVIACVVLAGLVGTCSLQTRGPVQGTTPSYDAAAALQADADVLDFPVRLPRLPGDWQPNSGGRAGIEGGRTGPNGERQRALTARVGYIAASKMYLSLTQSNADETALVQSINTAVYPSGVQDIAGVKVRVLGDAVYDQDRWLPQIAVGAQFKSNDQGAIVRAVGGKDDSGVDYYVAATKLVLDKSLVLNGTLRATKANQTGLLGFGGPKNAGYQAQFEGSAALLLNRRLAVGVEYRSKPDNLGLKEDDWMDVFAAYAVNKALSVTAGYADLGEIATFGGQRGLYLSLQAGF